MSVDLEAFYNLFPVFKPPEVIPGRSKESIKDALERDVFVGDMIAVAMGGSSAYLAFYRVLVIHTPERGAPRIRAAGVPRKGGMIVAPRAVSLSRPNKMIGLGDCFIDFVERLTVPRLTWDQF